MKIKMEIEMTPQEAKGILGLDKTEKYLQSLQDKFMEQLLTFNPLLGYTKTTEDD